MSDLQVTSDEGALRFLADFCAPTEALEEPPFMERTAVRRSLAFICALNGIFAAAGYRYNGPQMGMIGKADADRIDDAIKYGVSPDEFADAILQRDGFREPMTSGQAGAL